jgi:ribonuclease P protein component
VTGALPSQDAPAPDSTLQAALGRLVQTADFKRLLSVPPAFRTAHFALHHLGQASERPSYARKATGKPELSTDHELGFPQPVDESQENPDRGSPGQGFPRWVGCVVPKRHARRAVTRNLIKRQIQVSAQRVHMGLPEGMWLVRLRQPFPVTTFPSAASQALRQAVRAELDRLFQKAATRPQALAATVP